MKRFIAIFIFLVTVSCVLHADGGGGMFSGYQTCHYPILSDFPVSRNTMGLLYFGGYGYGISENGNLIGGFGYAILDQEGITGIAGGMGGILVGKRIMKRPISLMLVSWTGFGGIYSGKVNTGGAGSGFFCISQELQIELGIPLTDWFVLSPYLGYQVVGNLIPGKLFSSFVSYTPVIGVKITWGNL